MDCIGAHACHHSTWDTQAVEWSSRSAAGVMGSFYPSTWEVEAEGSLLSQKVSVGPGQPGQLNETLTQQKRSVWGRSGLHEAVSIFLN